MWKNKSEPENSDIIIDGFILKSTQTISDKGKIIQITGKNVLEFLFSTPVFLDTKDLGALTSPEIIELILKDINNKNANGNTGFQIKYTGPSSTGTISTLKSNGTPITDTHSNLQSYWKKASLLIEDYSGTKMTGDEYPHMAYVDIDETSGELYFYWQPRNSDVTDTTITEGIEPSQIKTGYKSDVVNMIIANCGQDPRNHGITVFVPNYPSINKNGVKWKYEGRHRNTAEELMTKEEQTNTASFETDSRFPLNTEYPYTTQWGTSCADDDEYTKAVRDEAKKQVKKLVQSEMSGTFDPKFIVDIELPGIPDYSLGQYIPHEITSNGFTSKENLRLVSISNSFWNSGMTSEEDKPGESGVS